MNICKGINQVIMENLPEILRLKSTGSLKPDGTFISKGDLLCEKLIFDYLTNHLSNYLVFSEESVNDMNGIEEVEYVITVDPIDGTENFVSGLKEWGVGVSVYQNMKHCQSMIFLPELDICLYTGDKLEQISSSRICGLSSYMTPADFEVLKDRFEYRIMGCCMYNMYNVIHGSYTQFQNLKGCYSWDILPGINLALEHGLKVEINGKEYNGEFLSPGVKYQFVVKSNSY